MKKQGKYNLLAKEEGKKEKLQEEWIEMEPVNKWGNKRAENSDTSYQKFEEEEEIEVSKEEKKRVLEQFKKEKQQSKNLQKSNLKSSNANILQQPITQPQRNTQPQQVNPPARSKIPPNQSIRPQQPIQNNIPRQPMNSMYINPPYNEAHLPQVNKYYADQHNLNWHQTWNGSGIRVHDIYYEPYEFKYASMYQVQRPRYDNYNNSQLYGPPQSQFYNNPNYIQPPYRQSQYNPNAQQLNNLPPSQFHQSQFQQPNPRHSILQNPPPPPKKVPQMTVNCDKCTFTQSVPGNTQVYICCMCNQMNECFPLYGAFTCGICKAHVIYPYGTSQLIKCTRCQTVNRVVTDPEKDDRSDKTVTMGKEQSGEEKEEYDEEVDLKLEQEEIKRKIEEIQYNRNKMVRNEPVSDSSSVNAKQQPFKILPSSKPEPYPEQIKPQKPKQYPQKVPNPQPKQPSIQQKLQQKYISQHQNQLKAQQQRQNIQNANKFQEQLIELDMEHKHEGENFQKQILKLSEKLDQSLVVSQKQEVHQVKKPQNDNYPSLFE